MMQRPYAIAALITGVLLLGLVFANVYYVAPSLKMNLVSLPVLEGRQQTAAPVMKESVATTMEKIKGMFAGRKASGDSVPRRVTRNPFLWPEEKYAIAAGRSVKTGTGLLSSSAQGPVTVKLILISEKQKVALIDNRLVQEGETVNGEKVYKINPDEVILKGPEGETSRLVLARRQVSYDAGVPGSYRETQQQESAMQEEALESFFEKLKPYMERDQ